MPTTGWGSDGGWPYSGRNAPRRRGEEKCPKCRKHMEVYLTYLKCPGCGRVIRRASTVQRERTNLENQQLPGFIKRMRESMLAPARVSSTPSSSEFMDLELAGSLAIERFAMWVLLALAIIYYYLPTLLVADPQPLSYTWGNPGLFYWLPLLLCAAAVGAVLHNSAQFRRILMLACGIAALACLAIALAGYRGFASELYAVYPHAERIMLLGRRSFVLLSAPGGWVWLCLNGGLWALCCWHIFHEDRQLGRI
ncbi:hypothetical protein KDL29_09335 [bacterium]|nr:hypothetical protein [bacterium]